MPIYEFVCESCGNSTEELVASGARDERRTCPACGRRKLHRKLSVFSARSQQTPPSAGRDGPASPCGRCGDPRGSCGMN